MAACCPPRGAEPFTTKVAERDARRLRKRGLDTTARRIADLAAAEGATVLEIGGGVGGLHLELLRRGALSATNVELSPTYEERAWELAREQGVEKLVDRRVLDFTQDADLVGHADVVLMHRVVCCSPDVEGLVGAAAARTQRTLVLSFPVDTWWMRAGATVVNMGARLARWDWRFYVHGAAAVAAAAEREGLRLDRTERSRIWRIAVFVRA